MVVVFECAPTSVRGEKDVDVLSLRPLCWKEYHNPKISESCQRSFI